MAKLIWTGNAVSDLEDIFDFIARDSPAYARAQIEKICQATERLRQFPESGRHLPEFSQLLHRELIVGNYRLIYRHDPQKDQAIIITVIHGSRLLNKPEN